MKPPVLSSTFSTVAFSGAGHLLAYHLGVASVLHQYSKGSDGAASSQGGSNSCRIFPPIRAVSGSSSGAIAAAILAYMPHRLQEYTDRFIKDRGRGFVHLREMLLEEEENIKRKMGQNQEDPELYVCVTKSEDGSPHLFPFPNHSASSFDRERLLLTIEASCRIPVSFHPLDLLKTTVSYEEEGININGVFYVDGGLSGVFPPPSPIDMGHNTAVTSDLGLPHFYWKNVS